MRWRASLPPFAKWAIGRQGSPEFREELFCSPGKRSAPGPRFPWVSTLATHSMNVLLKMPHTKNCETSTHATSLTPSALSLSVFRNAIHNAKGMIE